VVRLGLALALALSGLIVPSTGVLAQTVIATVAVGPGPTDVGVNPNTGRIYVSNLANNTVSVIDGTTNTVIATVGVGAVPSAVGVNPITGRVYVANQQDLTVSVIDGTTNTVIATVPVDLAPIGVGVNPTTGRVYVANANSNIVSVIDGTTNAVIARIGTGSGPYGVGVNPNTGRVYVANDGHRGGVNGNTVSVIDGTTNTVIATVGVGAAPRRVGVNPTTGRVYVANDGGTTVSVIDGTTNTVIATVGVGSAPFGVGVNPTTGRIYVANEVDNTVSVIDGTTNTVIATVGVGSNPFGVGVNANAGRIYVGNYGSNTVSVIQDTSRPPATLALAPAAATNPVGTQHCVTANAKDASGTPTPDITVRLSVRGAATTSGTKTTDANGQATFCYPGPELPGTDAISAFADTNNNGTQDAGEPSGTATKKWTLPVSTPGCAAINRGRITANNADKATFDGQAKVSSDGKTVKGQETYHDQGPGQPLVKSLNVQAVTCNLSTSAKQASIFGQATIKGAGNHAYKIDVTDSGDPGTNDTYRILLDTGYDSGVHKLETGKVEIRQK
jgi:YVTN family beta-propeller protein